MSKQWKSKGCTLKYYCFYVNKYTITFAVICNMTTRKKQFPAIMWNDIMLYDIMTYVEFYSETPFGQLIIFLSTTALLHKNIFLKF